MFRTWMNNFNVLQQQLPLPKAELPASMSNRGFFQLVCSFPADKQKCFHRCLGISLSKKVAFTHYTKALHNPPQVKSLYRAGIHVKTAIPVTSLVIHSLGVNSE